MWSAQMTDRPWGPANKPDQIKESFVSDVIASGPLWPRSAVCLSVLWLAVVRLNDSSLYYSTDFSEIITRYLLIKSIAPYAYWREYFWALTSEIKFKKYRRKSRKIPICLCFRFCSTESNRATLTASKRVPRL